MNIGSLCRRHIVSIDAAAPLSRAAALMRDQHVGALVVTRADAEGTQVGGLVTDRDLVVDVLARGLDPGSVRIGELARTPLVSVHEGEDLASAVEALQRHGVRRLLVVDDQRALVGLVSLDDLLEASAAQLDGLAQAIRGGIEREADRVPPPPTAPVLRVPAMGTAGWGPTAGDMPRR